MISAILLSGGSGSRMGSVAEGPKQYMMLGDKAVVRYSFDVLLETPEIDEIIVVCNPSYHDYFSTPSPKTIRFATQGARRQDSVYNGLQATSSSAKTVLIHDGARPFIDREMVLRVLSEGLTHGAATAAMQVKNTIRIADPSGIVVSTPDRSNIWEIQTPQVVSRNTLIAGFKRANDNAITVTDDVSLAELIGLSVKLVEGSYNNIKITVPADLAVARNILETGLCTTTN